MSQPAIVFTSGLDLRSQGLFDLPPQIYSTENLKCLLLDGNRMTTIPTQFGMLSSLETLSLHGNRLTVLPDAIGNLANLKETP